jgi:hypothetical protein
MTMTRSKIIPAIVAAFCGLALQFHASGANAQTTFVGGTNVTYRTAPQLLYYGSPTLCSPYWANCLYVDALGNIILENWEGGIRWSPSTNFTPGLGEFPGDFLEFQTDGNLVLYGYNSLGDLLHIWRTGTTDWDGDPGYYMAVQDDGNFVIYDYNWNPVFSAQNDPNYQWWAQELIAPHFQGGGAADPGGP